MNPYDFTVINAAPGDRAVARAKDKQIRGTIVVRKDATITEINVLAGETLEVPAPAAFTASILPRASFKASGMDITPEDVSSHDSVYRAVTKGLCPKVATWYALSRTSSRMCASS